MPYYSFNYYRSAMAEEESSYSYEASFVKCRYDESKGVTGDNNYYKVQSSDS